MEHRHHITCHLETFLKIMFCSNVKRPVNHQMGRGGGQGECIDGVAHRVEVRVGSGLEKFTFEPRRVVQRAAK